MTQACAGCLALVVMLIVSRCAVAAAEPPPFKEPNRPQFHYTPAKNWMNDPNGLVYFEGEYHLFHQYNPHGDTWGHMSWAHAVSRDLLHWEHLPVALREEDGVMIFSGSAVVDEKNTSGFGTEEKPPMVAIYTGHTGAKQTQNLAYSTDRGRTWTKFAGNPVIDEKLNDFRDPKVFWHEPGKQWVMVVAVSDQRKVWFYGSPDLKKWTRIGEFGGQGATQGIWECPDLFELPVDFKGGRKWALIVSTSDGSPGGGGGVQYFVGDFDGRAFRNGNPPETQLWADHGSDFFAAQSFANMPDDRRVWLAWMGNWRYAAAEPTKPWRGAMTIPREVRLGMYSEGIRLKQQPVRELADLRGPMLKAEEFADAGQSLDIQATFLRGESTRITVCGDGAHGTSIGYDAGRHEIYVDREQVRPGAPFHKDFNSRHAVALPEQSILFVRILVDRSSIEVFASTGDCVITDRIFPPPDARRLSVEGPVSMEVFRLKSVWPEAQR